MSLPAKVCIAPDWSAEPPPPPQATCSASHAMSRWTSPLTAYPSRAAFSRTGWSPALAAACLTSLVSTVGILAQPNPEREPNVPWGARARIPALLSLLGQDGRVATDSPSRPADTPDVEEPGEAAETTHVEVTEEEPSVTVEVIEPPIPDRVRRPADLFRLVVALVLLIGGVSLGVAAVGTSGAVEQDLADAVSGLPRLLLTLLTWLGAIGVVLLPFVVGTDLIMRRRPMQLVQALGAAVLGALLVIGLVWAILSGPMDFLQATLTKANSEGRSAPLDIVIVSTVGLLTVADVMGRKWISPLAITVLAATAVAGFLSGSVTAAAIVCSLLLGWAIGLGFRYAFGATSTRPPGTEVARALVSTGIPLTRLELAGRERLR